MLIFVIFFGTFSPQTTYGVIDDSVWNDNIANENSPMGNETPFNLNGNTEFLTKAQSENWTGNGSIGNPYIIENYTINGSGFFYCMYLRQISYYFVIRNCTLGGADVNSTYGWKTTSLYITNSDNCVIENCTFENDTNVGIVFSQSDLIIRNNTFYSASRGIYGSYSKTIIINNTFYGVNSGGIILFWEKTHIVNNWFIGISGANPAIHLYNMDNYSIENNYIYRFGQIFSETNNLLKNDIETYKIHNNTLVRGCSIRVCSGYNISIMDNSIDMKGIGISLEFVYNCRLRNNILKNCGVFFDNFDFTTPTGNGYLHDVDNSNSINGMPILYMVNETDKVIQGNYSEVFLYKCNNITFSNKTLPSQFFGFFIIRSNNITITDNLFGGGMRCYLHLVHSNFCQIINNIGIYNCRLWAWFSYDSVIKDNMFNASYPDFYRVHRLSCVNNSWQNISSHGDPLSSIGISGSDDIKILNNTFAFINKPNPGRGVAFSNCIRAEVKGNNITGAGFYIRGDEFLEWSSHDWDDTNYIDGKLVLYRNNVSGQTISGDYGQVLLGNCSNSKVKDLSFSNISYPLLMGYCSNVTVRDCTFAHCVNHAMMVDSTKGLLIQNVTLTGGACSLKLDRCTDSLLDNNIFSNLNLGTVIDSAVILERCLNISITKNIFDNITYSGLYLDDTDNCIVTKNIFMNCTHEAITVKYNGDFNLFFFNSFVDNNKDPLTNISRTPQCKDYSRRNDWDNGTIGNYWSDYRTAYPNASNDGHTWNLSYILVAKYQSMDDHPLVNMLEFVPPTAIVAGNITINQWETAYFNGSGWDNVGIVNYSWSFFYNGERIILYDRNVSFKFDLAGTYLVVYRVIDASHNFDLEYLSVTVQDIELPVPRPGPYDTQNQDTVYQFNGSASTDNVGIVNFTWHFMYDGEPIYLYGPVVSFTFHIPDRYNVTLNVTDLAGNSAEGWMILRIIDIEKPKAVLGDDIIIDMGQTVIFSGNQSTDNKGIVSFNWTVLFFGTPVSYGSAVDFEYNFTKAGSYTVILNVTDAANHWDTAFVNVTVRDTEAPKARCGDDAIIPTGFTLVLDASESTDNVVIVNYTWGFVYDGEVIVLYGVGTSFTFHIPGFYTIQLMVVDSSSNIGTTLKNVEVRDFKPPDAVLGEDLTIDEGHSVNISGTLSTDNVGVVSYQWTVTSPDSQTDYFEGVWFNHTFDVPGVFTVTLNVTDAAGNSDFASLIVTVLDVTDPIANAGSDATIEQGTLLTLNATGSVDNVGVVEWVWTIETSGEPRVVQGSIIEHLFEGLGTFKVVLTVSDAVGNMDTATIVVTVIDAMGPIARAGSDVTVDQGTTVTLDGTESEDNMGIVEWLWTVVTPEGAVNLEGAIAEHRFDIVGTYDVFLNVSDAAGNRAMDSLFVHVLDIEPPVADAGDDIEVDQYVLVVFNGSRSTDNVAIVDWSWEFEYDGQQHLVHGPSPSFIFDLVGTYLATMTIMDDAGNVASDRVTIIIHDTDPPEVRTTGDLEAIVNVPVVMDGTSSTDNVGIVRWIWAFEYNGTTAVLNGSVVEFTFSMSGEYSVRLSVSDLAGNTSTDTFKVVVLEGAPDVENDEGLPFIYLLIAIVLVSVVLTSLGLNIFRKRR